MRRLSPLLLLLLAAGCPRTPAVSSSTPKEPVREPIVVALVVDQMAAWAATERWPLLPEDGGFARLRREGTWFRDARYAHSATDTAPGHAAIFTGVTPRESGIVNNERIDGGKHVSFLRDATTKLVDAAGVQNAVGASIVALKVPTVADRLRSARPRATIVSVSIKDRGAIFGGGRHPTATIWFDASLDRFVTSTAFGNALPAWAAPHTTKEAVGKLRAAPWELLDRAFVEKHATLDDQEGEGDWEGLGRVFPHDVANAKAPAVAFRATPYADEAVLAIAHAAIRARDPSAPMFLAVSLSANDYVNHIFGPDSREAWDHLRRLDAMLAKLFAALDDAASSKGWSVVLTGDHGGVPIPELLTNRAWCAGDNPFRLPCGNGVRLFVGAMRDELDAVAVAAIGPGRWIDGVADPFVHYTKEAHALDPVQRKKLDDAVVAKLRATPGVEAVHVVRNEPAVCPDRKDESVAALVCRSVDPNGPGDLYVVARAGSFFDPRYAVGKGMNHGSPWLFDRSVPIVIRAPGRVDAGKIVEKPVDFETTTRALESLNGVPRPPSCCGVDVVH